MTADELIAKRKLAVARALLQFHPELLTAITSDKGSSEIADAINDLVEAHCLKLMVTLAPSGPEKQA